MSRRDGLRRPAWEPLAGGVPFALVMAKLAVVARWAKAPLWFIQLFTSAKSFGDNPIIGSPALNRLGLHRLRVATGAALCRWRRKRLAAGVPAAWREAFERDGIVIIRDFLPEQEFRALRSAILGYRGPVRETRQGDAITRRLAVDADMRRAIPALRALLGRNDLRGLFHYVAGFRIEPLHYIQTVVTHAGEGGADPQEALHADAFHASLKSWFFLNDLADDEAPFTYVPGSHVLTAKRLDWEHRRSTRPLEAIDGLSARGSPRIGVEELAALGLPQPIAVAARANMLVVADTFGFHARGASARPAQRVEVWSYARRNPFLPWLGGDILSLPGFAERRVHWLWAARDRLARASRIGQPWRPVGIGGPLDEAAGTEPHATSEGSQPVLDDSEVARPVGSHEVPHLPLLP